MSIRERIEALKRGRNAVILAHNYQSREVQEIADFVGDSLELSLKSMSVEAEVIVFAGVYFMAEQAKILNPDKRVLIPNRGALCSLAAMVNMGIVNEYKNKYPNAPLVVYVNSPANIKAVSDYVVTSANALDVISKLDAETILFSPDANLASYVAEKTGKNIVAVPSTGHCYVHLLITPSDIISAKKMHPNAVVMVHPEVPPETRKLADFIGGTGAMVRYVGNSGKKEFIVGTEVGMINRLERDYPNKLFYPATLHAKCIGMKKTSLEDIYLSLKEMKNEVILDKKIMDKAREALNRTFDLLGL